VIERMTTTNISGYRFAALADLPGLKDRLAAHCRAAELRGTILLGREGINLFVAGSFAAIVGLIAEVRSIPGMEGFEAKFSPSTDQPFRRMLVKIRKEIIAFGVPGIDPAARPCPTVSAVELKQWLDEGRDVTLLDTRNDFEVKLGTFAGAESLGLDHFRDFPAAAEALPDEWKQRPLVLFCTGGIRCEKAGPLLVNRGFEQVFQLDGGILKYFEECGNEHYRGECFVFDDRVGLNATLRESGTLQCRACRAVVTAEGQVHPRYQPGVSCPACADAIAERTAKAFAEHAAAFRRIAEAPPGSTPYRTLRPILVPTEAAGRTIADCFKDLFGASTDWEEECRLGHLLDRQQPLQADHRLAGGERLFHRQPWKREPDVNADVTLLHEDDAIIVVHKPALLPLRPSGAFQRNCLTSFLRSIYAPQKPRPSHHLDADVAGIIVFARTAEIARRLQAGQERGDLVLTYQVGVSGSSDVVQVTFPHPVDGKPMTFRSERG